MTSQENKIHSYTPRQTVIYWIGILIFMSTYIVSANQQQQQQLTNNNNSSQDSATNDFKENNEMNSDSDAVHKIKYNCDDDDSTESSDAKKKVCSQSKLRKEIQLLSIKKYILSRLNISDPSLPVPSFIEPDSASFIRVKQLVENEQQHQSEKKHKKVYVKPGKRGERK